MSRWADYLRERRIARCVDEIKTMQELRDWATSRAHQAWAEMAREIRQRSPEQVARMERARVLRV